jgi:hypothetical protein
MYSFTIAMFKKESIRANSASHPQMLSIRSTVEVILIVYDFCRRAEKNICQLEEWGVGVGITDIPVPLNETLGQGMIYRISRLKAYIFLPTNLGS